VVSRVVRAYEQAGKGDYPTQQETFKEYVRDFVKRHGSTIGDDKFLARFDKANFKGPKEHYREGQRIKKIGRKIVTDERYEKMSRDPKLDANKRAEVVGYASSILTNAARIGYVDRALVGARILENMGLADRPSVVGRVVKAYEQAGKGDYPTQQETFKEDVRDFVKRHGVVASRKLNASRAVATTALISGVAGLFLSSNVVTGNVIGAAGGKNILGVALIVIAIAGLFFWNNLRR
jgi:hypothetical protein